MQSSEKRKMKSTLKRRYIALLVLLPVGIGFALLFYFIFGSEKVGLQLVLTVVCWGAVIALFELMYWWISSIIAKKNENKPKRRDPFAD